MTRIAAWILILTFLGSVARAQEEWPQDLSRIQSLVKSVAGDISYDRVDVRRRGNAVEVSISLNSVPSQFRARSVRAAGDEDVFLATNFIQVFREDSEVAEFTLTPRNADVVDHFFGFWVFNLGKKVKLPAEINVIGQEGQGNEVQDRTKKFKVKKRTLALRFVEAQVSGPGLYALQTAVGSQSLTTYFCNSC